MAVSEGQKKGDNGGESRPMFVNPRTATIQFVSETTEARLGVWQVFRADPEACSRISRTQIVDQLILID